MKNAKTRVHAHTGTWDLVLRMIPGGTAMCSKESTGLHSATPGSLAQGRMQLKHVKGPMIWCD